MKIFKKLRLCSAQKGYVILLLTIFIPLILFGAKLCLDISTKNEAQLYMQPRGEAYRKCAKEASLAVAKNWNPALSLKQQKRAAQKIADKVYNDYKPTGNTNILASAIPGVEISTIKSVEPGKGFNPLKVNKHLTSWTAGTVEYSFAPKYLAYRKIYRNGTNDSVPWNLPFIAWKIVDYGTSLELDTYDKFDELDETMLAKGGYVINHFDRFQYAHQLMFRKADGYPTRTQFLPQKNYGQETVWQLVTSSTGNTAESGCTQDFAYSIVGESTSSAIVYSIVSTSDNGTYAYRTTENTSNVEVGLENDKIKVKTDLQTAYAIPAECNIDIILTCPTNMAACNVSNQDANTTISGEPYTSANYTYTVNDDIKSCPIYQIGQAFREFAKKFYHTRGVTIGLIPYSGKVSLNPAIADKYTVSYHELNGAYFQQQYYNQVSSDTASNGQNAYPAYIRQAIAYDSYGMTDKDLNNSYDWNTALTACPIRGRAGNVLVQNSLGNNVICAGDLLSTAAPTTNETKFLRQNSNPCYGGYMNLLKMRCEQTCTTYLPNPYYIIEPTADVQKIYEVCGTFYPFYDKYNNSNFIFIPVTWANNLWQKWTNDPQHAASDDATDGRLSTPSKTTPGRKKVLILVVNKPDWFEPHELTHLGFDNDYSEIPMIESDCILFDRDYATSQVFADGSSSSNIIQGAKKILKFEGTNVSRNSSTGYYECSSGSGKLTFPKKALLKIVVEPMKQFEWQNIGTVLKDGTGYSDWSQLAFGGNIWTAINKKGHLAQSPDAKIWTSKGQVVVPADQVWNTEMDEWSHIAYGNGIWMLLNYNGDLFSSSDGLTWTSHPKLNQIGYNGWLEIKYDGNMWFAINYWASRGFSTDNAASWDFLQDTGIYPVGYFSLAYLDGLWMLLSADGLIKSSSDGSSWTVLPTRLSGSNWRRIYAANNYWIALSTDGVTAISHDKGNTWSTINGTSSNWTGLCYGNGHFVACGKDGDIAFLEPICKSTIKFSGIASKTDGTTINECTLTERKEFFIEPDQITSGSDGAYYVELTMENIRLISAEITNRPYVRVTPTVSRSGNTFTLNAKVPFVIPVTVSSTSAKITYTNTSGSTADMSVTNSAYQIDPSRVLYTKSWASDGTPRYRVTLTPSSVTLGNPMIGTLEERTGSISGLNIDYDNGRGSFTCNGDTFSYTKTKPSDVTNSTSGVTVSGNKITCPIGSVLHVKANPSLTRSGSITFYDDNGVKDNVGTHNLTETKTFTFRGASSGPKNMWDWRSIDCSMFEYSTSGGVNFSHNMSIWKIKFSTSDANITSMTLNNQVVGFSAYYKGDKEPDKKTLIPNDTSERISDTDLNDNSNKAYIPPCVSVITSAPKTGLKEVMNADGLSFEVISGNYIDPTFYGITNGKCLYAVWANDQSGGSIYTLSSGNTYELLGSGNGWGWWKVFKLPSPYYSDRTVLKMSGSINLAITGLFLLNSDAKTYSSSVTKTDVIYNRGVGILEKNSQKWICFCGDGDLSVTVEPTLVTAPTITFNCANESNTTHELYKEGNFCIEPSQMTNNGDGTQSVTYSTTGSVTVTATCEKTNQTTLAVSKPSDVVFATFDITGHKKEMKWNAATTHPRNVVSGWSWAQRNKSIEYDGTTCYISSQQTIVKSNDLGKTWSAACNIPSMNSPEVNFVYAGGAWYLVNTNGQVARSYDSGSNWDIYSPSVLTERKYLWTGFCYANKRCVCVNCYGYIYVSDDGKNWSDVLRAKTIPGVEVSNDGWDSSPIFVDGQWIAWTEGINDSDGKFKLIKSENNGSSWSHISTTDSALSTNLSQNMGYLCYGSNIVVLISVTGKIYTVLDTTFSNATNHSTVLTNLGFSTYQSLGYANGTFMICSRTGQVAYTTYHDGVMWRGNDMVMISRDTSMPVTVSINTAEHSGITSSNTTITDISTTYLKVIPLNPTIAFEYTRIRMPDSTRYIDFSTNPYTTYNSSGIHSNLTQQWKYDSEAGCYVNVDHQGYHLHQYFDGVPGDYFTLADLTQQGELKTIISSGEIWEESAKRWYSQYPAAGLYRNYIDFSSNGYAMDENRNKAYAPSMLNDYKNFPPGAVKLVTIGLTLPINTMLYYGANRTTAHAYKWQSDTSGNVTTYDSTEAVKNVTKDACKKLKEDYGNNLRVYLIKYRKQGEYKHPVTGTTTSFDYKYLDDCASDSSYIYDVENESGLQDALSSIAKDIKSESWANYQEARNVEQ